MPTLADQFYAGRYADIIAEFVDGAGKIDTGTAVYVIGSLCFMSRAMEAESLRSIHLSKMGPRERFETTYYLVTALRRQRTKAASSKARSLLIGMIKDIRKTPDADQHMHFFVCCGVAFYRYIDGRFPAALYWAHRAYDHAFKAEFPFGRLVAYDLIGHSQLNSGQIRAGMKNLAASAAIANSLGRGAIKQAVDVASRLYRSTFGLAAAPEILAELSGAIKACEFENSYTLANLYIELARLQILAGDGHLAESSLRDASESVYRLDMPFMDAHLTFRYAHLALLQGDYAKAMELLRTAKNRARDAQSTSLLVSIYGLECRALAAMGKHDEAIGLAAEIRGLGNRSGQVISRRINFRRGIVSTSNAKRGEDLLGDLIDDIHMGVQDARLRVIKSGFLGLIPEMLGLQNYGDAIIFGFEGDSVTVCFKGQIRHDPDGWPELVRKLTIALSTKRQMTKAEITQAVWRQSYNPLRHDPLIYALIARTRKTLESAEIWLKVEESSYRLSDSVVVKDVAVTAKPLIPGDPAKATKTTELHHDVTYRQSKILELCAEAGALTNKTVCEAFQISEITAGRDLADLTEKGYLKRLGKGRATTYTKA